MAKKDIKIENDFKKKEYLEWLKQDLKTESCHCANFCNKPIIYDFTKDLIIDKEQTEQIEENTENLSVVNFKMPLIETQIKEINQKINEIATKEDIENIF